ncbi:MAG: FAD-linked oxidase C-terminal domain-containing protein, partial [Planctomycetota bacterium]
MLSTSDLGYAYPILVGDDCDRVWELRKAGLGLLSNLPGDAKPAPVIEDTAVDVNDLPRYIGEFNQLLTQQFGLQCVHYAHAGSGEIHLRPILNLKTEEGQQQYRGVAEAIAALVKKYGGSLSGEHGDGRLRGEFLRQMIGPQNYEYVRQIKQLWDPTNIFNPGKIIDTPAMDDSLRFTAGQSTPTLPTVFDWSSTHGMVRATEMCNGSGDCRKTHLAGGVMCPSYMATRDENDTTRARANLLRTVIQQRSTTAPDQNPLADERLHDVLDLCLSCKGCKRECPSTVDMAKLKAEFLQAYHDVHGISRRDRAVANFVNMQRWVRWAPWAFNVIAGTKILRSLFNRCIGFHPKRSLPPAPSQTVRGWFEEWQSRLPSPRTQARGAVVLFLDEFTNYQDTSAGIASIQLLHRLGYEVRLAGVENSGRALLSKGMLRRAKKLIQENVQSLIQSGVGPDLPMVGIEPSALLTFRDESLDLADDHRQREDANRIAEHAYLLDEFLVAQHRNGHICSSEFDETPRKILFHGHCYQKALGANAVTKSALSIPTGHQVSEIESGCCGMAGSFGYVAGNDTMSGGDGSDTFVFTDNFGNDSVVGGEGGTDEDVIDLSGLSGPVTVT